MASANSAISGLCERLDLLLPPLLSTQRSSWEQGICAQALLESHRFFVEAQASPKAQNMPYDFAQWLYALAHDSLVRQAPDGRLAVLLNGDGASDAGAVDPACIGETLYYLCAREANDAAVPFPPPRAAVSDSLCDGVEKMLRYIMESCPRAPLDSNEPTSPDQLLLSHRTDAVQIWSDTVYMLSPFLASAATFRTLPPSYRPDTPASYDPHALMEKALRQVDLAATVLEKATGEWAHIYDFDQREFKRAALWGVGNGWVCAGIVRILNILACPILSASESPDQRDVYPDLDQLGLGSNGDLRPLLRQVYDILLNTLRACLRHKLPGTALFHDVLDDPHSFVETNLAQMLAYTIYRLLDLHAHSARFRALGLPPLFSDDQVVWEQDADAMREAARAKTDRWGFVRDVCGSPTFDKPGTAAEGQAWGVMMEVAWAQYSWHKQSASGK
ncbi:hypothetical protein ONZ51_g11163 [Trametes cubensis]|uniref:Uncharacterized protein n=1 Tax=Trametes cubensis TaxID=1111947 RepID=A0AAD7TI14_9APHY|nr:hypothetical protein ONZ51_g11163 [Trametes cubensis]